MKKDFILVLDDGVDQFLVKRQPQQENHNVNNDILRAIDLAQSESPEEWNYSDVRERLVKMGYEVFSCLAYEYGS